MSVFILFFFLRTKNHNISKLNNLEPINHQT